MKPTLLDAKSIGTARSVPLSTRDRLPSRCVPLCIGVSIFLAASILLPISPNLARIATASPLAPQTKQRDSVGAPKGPPAAPTPVPTEISPRGEPLLFENAPEDISLLGLQMWGATLSPDGKTIATAHGALQTRGEIQIWDRETGKVKQSLSFEKGVRSLGFSPNGKVLVSAAYDGVVRFHDPTTFAVWGQGNESSGGHKNNGINSVCFFKGGKYIATGGFDHTIRLWDIPAILSARQDGKTVNVSPVAILEGNTNVVMSVSGTEDGKTLLSGGFDNSVRVWDIPDSLPKMGEKPLIITKERVNLAGHESAVEVVAISPDGMHLASGAQRGRLRVRDKTGTTNEIQAQFNNGVTCAVFSRDGKYLAVGGGLSANAANKEVRIWDVAEQKEIKRRTDFSEGVKGLEFTPDGKTLVVGVRNQTIHIWPWAEEKDKQVITASTGYTPQSLLAAAVSPDGTFLAFSGESKSVFIYKRAAGMLVAELTGHEDVVSGIAFSPDGNTLATSSYDKSIKLWNTETWREQKSLTGHTGWVFGIAFSPDGKTLASGSYDKTIRLWNVQTGETKTTWKEHTAGIRSIAFSPDGKKLISAGSDRTIRIWEVAEGSVSLALKGHKNAVRSVAFSPDGKIAVSGAEDMTVKLWDAETGKEMHTFSGLPDMVTAVRFSPKGQVLLAATFQGQILVLDPLSHRTRQTLRGHNESVSEIVIADKGEHLVSVSLDHSLRQWTVAKTAIAAPMQTLSGKIGMVANVAVSPNGSVAVLGTIEGSIAIWDLRTDALQYLAAKHPEGISQLAISNQPLIACAGKDGSLDVGSRDGTTLWKGKGSFAVFAPNGKQLAVADGKDIVLYEAASGKEIKRLIGGHDGNVVRLDFSPDGARLISADQDTKVRLWNVATGKKLQITTAFGNESAITQLAFSSDGARFAAAAFGPAQPSPDDMTGEFRPIREVRVFTVPANPEAAFANPILLMNQPNDQPLSGLHWTSNPIGLVMTASNGSVRLVELNGNGVAERQRFNAHESAVLASAVSLEGGLLITAGEDMAVRRWRLPGVELIPGQSRVISPGLSRVWSLAQSPDGKYAVAAGEGDKAFRVYAGLPTAIPVEADNYPAVISMAFSPDNLFLVTGHTNGILIVRDAATGKPLRTLKGPTKAVVSVAFAERGAALVTVGVNSSNGKEPGEALVWDFPAGTIRHKLNAPANQTMVAAHPDGKSVAISSSDGRVRVWDVGTGKLLTTYGKGGTNIKMVAFDATGSRIATGGFDQVVRIWDTSSGEEIRSISTAPLQPTKVLFSPDGQEIVISTWHGGSGQPVRTPTLNAYSLKDVTAPPRQFAPHPVSIMSAAFLPDGRTLISSGGDANGSNTLRAYDFASGRLLGQLAGHRHWVQSFAVSADGKTVASTSWAMWATGEFRLWDPRGFHPIAEVKIPNEQSHISTGAIGLNGKLLVLGSWGQTLTAWDMTDPKKPTLRKQINEHNASLRSVAFDDAGKRFVTADEGGEVKVWDAATLERIVSFKASTTAIYRAKFAPDGTKIVTVGGDWKNQAKSEMRVWDSQSGLEIGRFPVQAREVWDVAFLNGGKLMAALPAFSGTPEDTHLKIWDFEKREIVQSLIPPGTFNNGRCLGVSPDGKHLAVGSSKGPVKVLETAAWKEVLNLPNLQDCSFQVDFTRDGNCLLIASGEGAAISVRLPKLSPIAPTPKGKSSPPLSREPDGE